MLHMEDVIVYVALIDRQHLPRHALITAQPTFAMFNEPFTCCLKGELACIGPIDARGKLAFDADAKCIGSFLVGEMFALAMAPAVPDLHLDVLSLIGQDEAS